MHSIAWEISKHVRVFLWWEMQKLCKVHGFRLRSISSSAYGHNETVSKTFLECVA